MPTQGTEAVDTLVLAKLDQAILDNDTDRCETLLAQLAAGPHGALVARLLTQPAAPLYPLEQAAWIADRFPY